MRSLTLDFYMDTISVSGSILARLWITVFFPIFMHLSAVILVVMHYVKEKMLYSSC